MSTHPEEWHATLSEAEVVAALDAIEPGDKECAHGDADDLLVIAAPPAVREAYIRAYERLGGFWYA
jgi:hypothetical protein